MIRAIVRCAALSLFLTFPLAAQTGIWTAVGSTGAIDDASLGIYSVGTNNLFHAAGATGTIVSRFNVTNTFGGGLTDAPPWTTLELTYFDNNAAGSVTATLFRANRCSSSITTLCSVTSVDATSPTCLRCTFPAGAVNFGAADYVVEVRVSRSATTTTPQLFGLQIF